MLAMRTTLDIDADVLEAAKSLARHHRRSAGAVISALARQALCSPRPGGGKAQKAGVGGFVPFASRGGVITNQQIDRLREGDIY
jgi:hypothetical protein